MYGVYLLPTDFRGEIAIYFRLMRRPNRETTAKGGASVFEERYYITSLDLETIELQVE
jgi:hypothetical protein